MNDKIKNLLKIITDANYRAYVVGGFVRDELLGFTNYDVDIVTDAPKSLLFELFRDYNPISFKYDTMKFKYGLYNVDIAHIRKEEYIDGSTKVSFSDDLIDDYNRRDFTINAIYIDKDEKIIDYGTGLDDCKNKTLRFINNPQIKCKEDPTRLFRGIYFILKYNLVDYSDIFKVNLDKNDILNLDVNALNKILVKILKLKKYKQFISILDECNLFNIVFENRPDLKDNYKPFDFLSDFKYIHLEKIKNN